LNTKSAARATETLTKHFLGKATSALAKDLSAAGAKAVMSIPTAAAETLLDIPMWAKSLSQERLKYHDGSLPSFGRAIGNALLDTGIEIWSERFGEPIDAILKLPFQGVGALMERTLPTFSKNAGRFFSRMNHTPAARMIHQAGYDGIIGEMAEEVVGDAVRTLTGYDPDALKQNLTWDNQITTFLSFLPTFLVGGTVKTAQVKRGEAVFNSLQKDFASKAAEYGYDRGQIEAAIGAVLEDPVKGMNLFKKAMATRVASEGRDSLTPQERELRKAAEAFAVQAQWKRAVDGAWASQQLDEKEAELARLERQYGGRITVEGEDNADRDTRNEDEEETGEPGEVYDEEGNIAFSAKDRVKEETPRQRRRRERREKRERYDELRDRLNGRHVAIVYSRDGRGFFVVGQRQNGQTPVRPMSGSDSRMTFLGDSDIDVSDGNGGEMTVEQALSANSVTLNEYLTGRLIFNEKERRRAIARGMRTGEMERVRSRFRPQREDGSPGTWQGRFSNGSGGWFEVTGQQDFTDTGLRVEEHDAEGRKVGDPQLLTWDEIYRAVYGEDMTSDENADEKVAQAERDEAAEYDRIGRRSAEIARLASTLKKGDWVRVEGRKLKIRDVDTKQGVYVFEDGTGNEPADDDGTPMRLSAEQLYDRGVRGADAETAAEEEGGQPELTREQLLDLRRKDPAAWGRYLETWYSSLYPTPPPVANAAEYVTAQYDRAIGDLDAQIKDVHKRIIGEDPGADSAVKDLIRQEQALNAERDALAKARDEYAKNAKKRASDERKAAKEGEPAPEEKAPQNQKETPKTEEGKTSEETPAEQPRVEEEKKTGTPVEERKKETPTEERKTEEKKEAPNGERKTEEKKKTAEEKRKEQPRKEGEEKRKKAEDRLKEKEEQKKKRDEEYSKFVSGMQAIGSNLGVKVVVLSSEEEIRKAAKDLKVPQLVENLKAGRAVTINGTIYVYGESVFADGNDTAEGALREGRVHMAHEAIAHIGLRRMMGEEKFREFCRKVYNGMDSFDRFSFTAYHWNHNMSDREKSDLLSRHGEGSEKETDGALRWAHLGK
ncbi:MAG: hypothetical protein LUC41_03560, partial [Clostridiales bacterium]|nr:hypothetical protein [Clostridiales bacterium]